MLCFPFLTEPLRLKEQLKTHVAHGCSPATKAVIMVRYIKPHYHFGVSGDMWLSISVIFFFFFFIVHACLPVGGHALGRTEMEGGIKGNCND